MGVTRFNNVITNQVMNGEAVDKLAASFDKLSASIDSSAKKAGQVESKFNDFGNQVREVFQNPLATASKAVDALFSSLGGVSAAAAGASAAVVGLGAGMFTAAQSAANLAEQHANMAVRLGMSIKEYGLFAAVAEDAGLNGEMLTTAMRGLTRALSEDEAEGRRAKRALADLGVEVRNQYGGMKVTRDILLDIADALDKMPEGTKQKAAVDIFERAGLQILPLFQGQLRQTLMEYERMGVGFDETGARVAQSFDDALDRMTRRLKTWWKDLGVGGAQAFQTLAPSLFDEVNPLTGKYYSQEERERYNAQLRAKGEEARRDYQIMQSGGILPFAPQRMPIKAPTVGDLEQTLATSRRQQIHAMLLEYIGDTQRLKDAEEDIERAREKNDPEMVRRALERKKALEAEIEATKKLRAEQEAFAKGLEKLKELMLEDTLAQISSRGIWDRTKSPLYADSLATMIAEFDVARGWTAAMMGRFGGFGHAAQDAALEAQRRKLGMLPEDRVRSDAERVAGMRAYLEHQERMVQLIAGPGGEVDAINKAYLLRRQMAALEEDAAERKRMLMDAEYRREEDLAALRRRGLEDYHNSVMSAFDAAISGGAGGLGAFAKSQSLGMLRTMVGNLAGMTYRPGLLSFPGLGTAERPSALGKLLEGTPFGLDPAAAAATQLSGAGVQLTAAGTQLEIAAHALMGVAAAGGGGGAAMARTSLADYFASMGGGGGTPSKYAGLYKALGFGGALAGGAFGAYSGFSAGGAQGALTGAASIAGAAGMALPMLSKSLSVFGPIGMVAGMGLGLAAALMGDPKQKRAEDLQRQAEARRFEESLGTSYATDIRGRALDTDYMGRLRPIVVNNYNIRAVDTQSFADAVHRNNVEVAAAVREAVDGGNADELLGAVAQGLSL